MAKRRFIRRARRFASGFSLNKITTSLSSVFQRPASLLLLVATIALITSELGTGTSLISKFKGKVNDTALRPLGNYLANHRNETIGFFTITTAVSAATPPASFFVFAAASGVITFLLPSAPYTEYVAQAVLALLFFKIRDPTSRIIIVGCAVAAFIGGYLFTNYT